MENSSSEGPIVFGAKGTEPQFMFTFTGRKFVFDDPYPSLSIIDIAHHLSMICRWTGAVKEFYSVAQHSVLCSRIAGEPRIQLQRLLHDAHEAYTNDLNSPVKSLISSDYRKLAEKIQAAIWKKYGLEPPNVREMAEMKTVDLRMAATEASQLMTGLPKSNVAYPYGVKELGHAWDLSCPWEPRQAQEEFLSRFKELM